ncbi:MAG: dTDP-4-dehydrorhamnose 3,5-epimerase [Myxococcota bacterium]
MKVTPLSIPEVLHIEPKVFGDHRGFFLESYSKQRYAEHGLTMEFVQDNISRSKKGILRGLHLQHPHDQAKLVSVLEGAVYDVAVDVRVGSPTFGQWVGQELIAEKKNQVYVPAGFAHGFAVLTDSALFVYKCTDYYHPETELGVAWNDPALGIDWPLADPILSEKDGAYGPLSAVPEASLPTYEAP